jgi:hypothetical protein
VKCYFKATWIELKNSLVENIVQGGMALQGKQEPTSMLSKARLVCGILGIRGLLRQRECKSKKARQTSTTKLIPSIPAPVRFSVPLLGKFNRIYPASHDLQHQLGASNLISA